MPRLPTWLFIFLTCWVVAPPDGALARAVLEPPREPLAATWFGNGQSGGSLWNEPPTEPDVSDGMEVGPNLYAYVKQNPWTSFDPEGLSAFETMMVFLREGTKQLSKQPSAIGGLGVAALPLVAVTTAVDVGEKIHFVHEMHKEQAHAIKEMDEIERKLNSGEITNNIDAPLPQPKPTQTDKDVKKENDEKANTVWRGGGNTFNTFTPAEKDAVPGDPDRGLSTFRSPLQAARKPGDKAQEIDLNRVPDAVFEKAERPDGHVSIRPRTQAELQNWAKSKPTANEAPHPYSVIIRAARTGKEFKNPGK